MSIDERWMQYAIEEAKKGEKTAFPNPMVGAVLVCKEGWIICEGFHEKPGSYHAERIALDKIEKAPEGAILYVTLEPCCSYGRTPPCVDIIVEKNVRHVVVGMLDPDSRMQGKGVALLKEQGIQVDVGILEEECRLLNFRYLNIRSQHRPTIAVKVGTSLDGKIVDAHGSSQWITSAQSRAHAHQLRSLYDGILVGSGTLLADNPSLNCRLEGGRNPTPILWDTYARCPSQAKVLTAGKRPILCVGRNSVVNPDLPVDYLMVEENEDGRLDLRSVLAQLYDKGMYTVLVEGGSTVIRSLIQANCVDLLEVYVGSVFLGGGISWGHGCDFFLAKAPRLTLRAMEAIDSDIHLSYFWEHTDV